MKNLTNKIGLFSLVILISLNSINAQSTFKGNSHSFEMLPDYKFESFVRSELTWEAKTNQAVQVSIKLTDLPDAISAIVIDAITFSSFLTDDIEEVGTRVGFDTIVPQDSLSTLNQEKLYNNSLVAPILGDNFYLNITIFARTTGNTTQGESMTYTYIFPDDQTILVTHEDDLVPLINLYGFPLPSFFESWLPIYIGILIILLSPGYVRFGYFVKTKINKENSLDE